jgi:hypothetical protein
MSDDRRLDAELAVLLFGYKWIAERRTGQQILVDSDTEWVESFSDAIDPLNDVPVLSSSRGRERMRNDSQE